MSRDDSTDRDDSTGRDSSPDRDDSTGRDDNIDLARPLARGSVSLRLYPHVDLSPPEAVRELRTQAVLATGAGFDGVMTSEHHGGFAGYMPNPLQAAGWLLEAMPTGWAAACPLLLTLRPPALVTEEVAWLAARFPGRVGLGLAAGSLDADFDIMGHTKDDLTRRFTAGLAEVAGALGGSEPGLLGTDPAVAGCVLHPIPVLSAAMSAAAAPARGALRHRPAVRLALDSGAHPPTRRTPTTTPAATVPASWSGEPGWGRPPWPRSKSRPSDTGATRRPVRRCTGRGSS